MLQKMVGLPIRNLEVCGIAFAFTFRIIQCELTLGVNRKSNACNIFLALRFSVRRILWPLKENFSAGNIDTRNKVRNISFGGPKGCAPLLGLIFFRISCSLGGNGQNNSLAPPGNPGSATE